MREHTTLITERQLMFCIAGQLYDQAPARLPRNPDTIMRKVREKIRSSFVNSNEFYSARIPDTTLNAYISEMLMSIPEFVALNLTQNDYNKGISVDDSLRPKYSISDIHTKETSESWKRDFIDLSAFIRNVTRRLEMLEIYEQDCGFCKYESKMKNEICESCLVNPDKKYHYECNRIPKGTHTFSCKFDCFKGKQICCEDCVDTTCVYRCDGSSETCGNDINHIKDK